MTGLRGTAFAGVQGGLSELPEPPRLQLHEGGILRDLMWQDCGSCIQLCDLHGYQSQLCPSI